MSSARDGERQIEILEVFTEEGELPSAVRESLRWKAAVKELEEHRDRMARVRRFNRVTRKRDKLLRIKPAPIEPLENPPINERRYTAKRSA